MEGGEGGEVGGEKCGGAGVGWGGGRVRWGGVVNADNCKWLLITIPPPPLLPPQENELHKLHICHSLHMTIPCACAAVE